jgi:uncharacterized protein YegJ (DUF2314 family)
LYHQGHELSASSACPSAPLAFFGSEEEVIGVKADDEALKRASARAKRAVRKYKARFAHGAPDLEQLTVKGPFTTSDDGVEWMWVEVVRWEGKTIHGVLQNDPTTSPTSRRGLVWTSTRTPSSTTSTAVPTAASKATRPDV